MAFDPAQFGLGIAGALVTLYMAKGEVVPEFRIFYDTSESDRRRADLKRAIVATQAYIDTAQEQLTSGGLSADDATALRAGIDTSLIEMRIDRAALTACDRDIKFGQLLSRSFGFLLYVGLGGLFAWLLADSVNIEGFGGNFESLVLGATWTTYVASAGFRVLEERVSKRVSDALEQATSKFESAKTTLNQSVPAKVEAAERREATDEPVLAPQVASEMRATLDLALNSITRDLERTRVQVVRDCRAAL